MNAPAHVVQLAEALQMLATAVRHEQTTRAAEAKLRSEVDPANVCLQGMQQLHGEAERLLQVTLEHASRVLLDFQR